MGRNAEILIIGKVPPPIGGVTIHVQRLISSLEKDGIPFTFSLLVASNFFHLVRNIFSHRLIHIHTSNPYVRLLLLLICTIAGKKSMFTLHGNLNRFNWLKNQLDYTSFRMATIPIVINEESYAMAKEKNNRTILASAFIPPLVVKPLPSQVLDKIAEFTSKYKVTCCTNAFNLSYDKNGVEIYGVTDLLQIFGELNCTGLIFSDPSRAYTEYWKDEGIKIPGNVLVLDFPHDFINIIHKCDVFLRTTTTDGDSLSVKEGLFFQKIVVCSDCVSRPPGCILYKTGDKQDLKKTIQKTLFATSNGSSITNGYHEIKAIYESKVSVSRQDSLS